MIGAGPYALSAAAYARARGIRTKIVGRPMAFWRENMPEEMFLRSGPDWHFDAAEEHTLEAFLAEKGIGQAEVDPLPIGVLLDYAEWFQASKALAIDERLVTELTKPNGAFEAVLEDGERVLADAVVAAPGIRHFTNLPQWADQVPAGRRGHTCEVVRFDGFADARVLIIGGRQSAYEWAALFNDHGAARIDVVHRHDVPRFAKVSWRFCDDYIDHTLAERGWWRNLPASEQEAIGRRFWEVGRLTLEYWLVPRLHGVHRHPGTEVVEVEQGGGGVGVRLSNDDRLEADYVVFASGYKANLANVPYLHGVVGDIEIAEGCPVLDEAFGTSLPGLYVTGFAGTRDFGPFFGFTKGVPAAATLMVRQLLSRA